MDIPFFKALLWGASITLSLGICALLLGLTLSLLYTLCEQFKYKTVSALFSGFNFVVRALPEIVTLFVIYFSLTALINTLSPITIYMPPFLAGVLALGITYAAYASQTIAGAFKMIPTEQAQSAAALGMRQHEIFFRIQVPQACYYALPGLGNLSITLLKDTAFVSLIGLPEIMNTAELAIATTKAPFTYYIIAATFYLLLTSLSSWGLKQLERKTNLDV